MHILNADVLSSILFSWCKSKLAKIISTEKLQFAYIGRFFFKTQIDQLPEEMYSMALAKKTLWMMLLILRGQQEPWISAQH